MRFEDSPILPLSAVGRLVSMSVKSSSATVYGPGCNSSELVDVSGGLAVGAPGQVMTRSAQIARHRRGEALPAPGAIRMRQDRESNIGCACRGEGLPGSLAMLTGRSGETAKSSQNSTTLLVAAVSAIWGRSSGKETPGNKTGR